MAIYLLPPSELSQRYLKSNKKHLIGLFIDMKKLKKYANERPGYNTVNIERREDTTGVQQNINMILKGDQKTETEKKEKITPELIDLIMNNPVLMASLNKQNARNYMSKPK